MELAQEIYEEWKEKEYSFDISKGQQLFGTCFFIDRITEKALLFENNTGYSFWIPKSVISVVSSKHVECGDLCNSIEIEIPFWIK